MILKKFLALGLEPNLTQKSYDGYTSTRSPTVKRRRPKGVELLFSGTTVSNSKEILTLCRYGGIWAPPSTYNWFEGGFRGTISVPPLKSDTARIRSAVKAQKVNVAQFLAEFPATARMFMDFASRIVRTRRALLKGRPMDVIDALSGVKPGSRTTGPLRNGGVKVPTKVLANNQLAFTYGVTPLMKDLSGAMSELYSGARSRPLIFQVHVSDSAFEATKSIIKNDGAWLISANSVNDNMIAVKRKTIVWIEMAKPSWLTTGSRLGFLNPIALAWELIPYSFVVDWFINVGESLQNLDAFTGVKRVGIHRTTTTSSYAITSIVPVHPSGRGGTSTRKLVTKSRSFSDVLPGQVPINWQPHLSFSRMLSALSLSRARFS